MRMPLILGCCVLLTAACGSSTSTRTETAAPAPQGGRVIDAERIAESKATNAWELLRDLAIINMAETPGRGIYRIQSRRGRSSLALGSSDVPLVVVDGVRVIEFGTLRQIPANVIQRIRVLSAIEGTTVMGTNATGGVVLIETTPRP